MSEDSHIRSPSQLQSDLERVLKEAMLANHFIQAEVTVIDRHPVGRRNDVINEMCPTALGQLSTTPTTLGSLVSDIEATAWRWMQPIRAADSTTAKRVSAAVGATLTTPKAEYFAVSGPKDGWPLQGVYWSRWFLSVDRVAGRSIGLCIAASD